MQHLSRRGLRCSVFNRTPITTRGLRSHGSIGENNNKTSSTPYQPLGESAKRHVTMVSTTRGTPSASIDLKEAVREKIPLHYDLLRKLRSQHGSTVISRITLDDIYEGLKGVNTLVRETSEVDPRFGVRYRGLTLPEVLVLLPRRSNAPSPEAVFWLLLTGDVPTYEQTASLVEDWSLRRQRQKKWWLESGDGSFVGEVMKDLPKNVTPLDKLSIALTALNASAISAKELRTKRSYTYWEHTYEEGMELLAVLPAIVGLVRNVNRDIKENPKDGDGDWVDFLLERSGLLSDTIDERNKASFADFLRLYIVANADEDGGSPGTHVTQILGASRMELSKTLAAGVLAYSTEPNTGTLPQCMDFQKKIQHVLGREPGGEALKDLISTVYEKDNEIIGHEEGSIGDSRYAAFSDFAKEHMHKQPDIKLSREISRNLNVMAKSTNSNLWPEQSFIAAPIFQWHESYCTSNESQRKNHWQNICNLARYELFGPVYRPKLDVSPLEDELVASGSVCLISHEESSNLGGKLTQPKAPNEYTFFVASSIFRGNDKLNHTYHFECKNSSSS